MPSLKNILQDSSTQLVDVRTPGEYQLGHARGAVNIPLNEFARRFNEIENLGLRPVVFYCQSGNRSGQAVSFLKQKGIAHIYNGGGLADLQACLN